MNGNIKSLSRLLMVISKLLEECPEDSLTTAEDWMRYLCSEIKELAIDWDSPAARIEELADVLQCVLFLSLRCDLALVTDAAVNKLVRRHPGMFGDFSGQFADLIPIDTLDKTAAAWKRAKGLERSGRLQLSADMLEQLLSGAFKLEEECKHLEIEPLPAQADGSIDGRCKGCGAAGFPIVDMTYEAFIESGEAPRCGTFREGIDFEFVEADLFQKSPAS